MEIEFTKMQGCGNDYVFILGKMPDEPEKVARMLSDVHFSVGADGMVLVLPSKVADIGMRIFNKDGSEAKICGNALRCLGKLAFENGLVDTLTPLVETKSGVRRLLMSAEKDRITSVTVCMGKASFLSGDGFVNYVDMGNRHAVIFSDDLSELTEAIPDVNTEYVRITGRRSLTMRVTERGSGETLSCGSGACAAVATGVKNGFLDPDCPVCVTVPGGRLTVICSSDYEMFLSGDAGYCAKGVAYL